MKKCPLRNFEKCDKDCAWYFNGLKKQQCAILSIATNDCLVELSSIDRNISSIEEILKENLKSRNS